MLEDDAQLLYDIMKNLKAHRSRNEQSRKALLSNGWMVGERMPMSRWWGSRKFGSKEPQRHSTQHHIKVSTLIRPSMPKACGRPCTRECLQQDTSSDENYRPRTNPEADGPTRCQGTLGLESTCNSDEISCVLPETREYFFGNRYNAAQPKICYSRLISPEV